jgi:hypothetical protein
MATEEEYRADQAARQKLTEQTLKVTESVPTPTQEELDMMRLGLMHPDDVAVPDNEEMPPVAVQQALLQKAQPAPSQRPPRPGSGGSAPAVPGAPTNRDVPHVTGNGAVGETLNCTMGNWNGEPTSYAYAWKRDGTADIATGANYVVVAEDSGHSLTCVVTATNAAGSTAAPPSNVVAVNGAARRAPAR